MKVLKRILSVLAIVLIAVLVVYGLAMLLGKQILYPAFCRSAQKGAAIPALSEGFTPQCVSYLDDCTLICGYFPHASSVVNPFVEFYRPIPPLAYYTLLVLWLGINEGSKITLLFLAGFAPIFISCASGVKRINVDYLNASYMLGANKKQTFMNIIFPSALPDIFTGLRTAIGFEYTTLVAAEMVAAKQGIGWMVLDASNWLKSDVVFAGVIIMGITGILLNYIILILENRIVHWSGRA